LCCCKSDEETAPAANSDHNSGRRGTSNLQRKGESKFLNKLIMKNGKRIDMLSKTYEYLSCVLMNAIVVGLMGILSTKR
jgi:hypothetical protein